MQIPTYPQAETKPELLRTILKRATQAPEAPEESKKQYQEAMLEQDTNNFWGTSITEKAYGSLNRARFLVADCFPVAKLNFTFKKPKLDSCGSTGKHRIAQIVEKLSRNTCTRIISFIDCLIKTDLMLDKNFNIETVDKVGIAYQESDELKHYQLRDGKWAMDIDLDTSANINVETTEAGTKYFYRGNLANPDDTARVEIKSDKIDFVQELEPGSRNFSSPEFQIVEQTEYQGRFRPKTTKPAAKPKPPETKELSQNYSSFIDEILSIDEGEASELVDSLRTAISHPAQVSQDSLETSLSDSAFPLYKLKSLTSRVIARTENHSFRQEIDQNTQATVKSKALALMLLLELISRRDGQLKDNKINLYKTHNFEFKIPIADDEWIKLTYKVRNGVRTYELFHNLNKLESQSLVIKRTSDDDLESSDLNIVEEYREKQQANQIKQGTLKSKTIFNGSLKAGGELELRTKGTGKSNTRFLTFTAS